MLAVADVVGSSVIKVGVDSLMNKGGNRTKEGVVSFGMGIGAGSASAITNLRLEKAFPKLLAPLKRRHDQGHPLRRPDPDERPPILRQPHHVLQRQGLYLHVDEGPPARLRDGGRQAGLLYLRHVRCPHQQDGQRHDVQLHNAFRQGHAADLGQQVSRVCL